MADAGCAIHRWRGPKARQGAKPCASSTGCDDRGPGDGVMVERTHWGAPPREPPGSDGVPRRGAIISCTRSRRRPGIGHMLSTPDWPRCPAPRMTGRPRLSGAFRSFWDCLLTSTGKSHQIAIQVSSVHRGGLARRSTSTESAALVARRYAGSGRSRTQLTNRECSCKRPSE